MSGWNDKDRLAEARALHNDFTGRSPGSSRRGANRGRSATGRGRGRCRGHGSTSPSPAHGLDGSGNKYDTSPASLGHSTPPVPLSGGLPGFGSNQAARGVGKQPAAPLATPDQFFAHFNNQKNTNAPAGSSAAVSGTRGDPATPTSQIVAANDAYNSAEPMMFDQPTQSNNVTANQRNPVNYPTGNTSAFARNTENNVTSTNNSSGPMNLDRSRNIQSTATPAKPESPKRGLVSSKWCAGSGASDTGTGPRVPTSVAPTQRSTISCTHSRATHMAIDKRAGDSKTVRFTGDTKPGLAASRWAESSTPPVSIPSELSPVYRSDNWIKDLREENAAQAMHQTAHPPSGSLGQMHDHSRGSNKEPAMRTPADTLAKSRIDIQPAHPAASANASITTPQDAKNDPALPVSRTTPASDVFMQGQASTELPAAYQFGTQSSSQHGFGFNQHSVGAVKPAVDRGPTYQPSSAGVPRQGQPQHAQVAATSPAIGADTSPNVQSLQHQVFGASNSPAGPGVEYTPQHVQQPAQPTNGNGGQQSAQPTQPSGNPFDDPDFKDFWENSYMRNKG